MAKLEQLPDDVTRGPANFAVGTAMLGVEVLAGEQAVHDLTNVGDTPLCVTTVELLQNDTLFWRPFVSKD